MIKKTLIVLGILHFSTTSLAGKNPNCGPITSMSFSGDHDNDWISGASIKLEDYVRITLDNSTELIRTLEKTVMLNEIEDTKGFFVCLDEYETYSKSNKKFARVSKYRVWKDGKLLFKSM